MNSCVVCGRDISTDDYYASIRRKYCKQCAANMKRQQNSDWAREMRKQIRERNALTRQLCEAQRRENEALRAEIVRLRDQLAREESTHE